MIKSIHLPDLLADKGLFAWSACFLYLSSDVNVSEEVDWSTHHVLSQWWFADRNMWVDGWFSAIKTRKIFYIFTYLPPIVV